MGVILSATSSVLEGFNLSEMLSMLTNLVTWVVGNITIFPINIFFGASLAGLGVGIFHKIKHI